jgi:uncharacterized protein (TIGR00375 family)
MRVFADLHVHSRFARAVSSRMVVSKIAEWSSKKGIDVVATGDWTHPVWYRELRANLVEDKKGLFRLKGQKEDLPLFLLSTEVSSIYSQGGETRRIHTLIFAPNFSAVERISKELADRGVKLMSDGRPVTGLSARDIADIALTADENCLVVPAHAWTPWFSLYGSQSGFDSILDCFQDLTGHIYAVETGLSSDPAMNWRIEELDDRQLVSFSDAHSPEKIGREVTVFDLKELNFDSIASAIKGEEENRIASTIEFYPEEGKYHYSGHRKCDVVYSPKEIKNKGSVCPVCGKPLTVGVMSRVETLASGNVETDSKTDKNGVRWIEDKKGKRPPYTMMVPLMEILSEVLNVGANTQTVEDEYEKLINHFGSELKVLLKAPFEKIESYFPKSLSEAISKVRSGDIYIKPGYDGVFGKVKIWKDEEKKEAETAGQESLF